VPVDETEPFVLAQLETELAPDPRRILGDQLVPSDEDFGAVAESGITEAELVVAQEPAAHGGVGVLPEPELHDRFLLREGGEGEQQEEGADSLHVHRFSWPAQQLAGRNPVDAPMGHPILVLCLRRADSGDSIR
jgi:hypothetical protein